MSLAERRAANRHRIAAAWAEPRSPGSIRGDGLTGAEVLEIWQRSGSAGAPLVGHGGKPKRLELHRG